MATLGETGETVGN